MQIELLDDGETTELSNFENEMFLRMDNLSK
jgi:hypothetical protein